MSLGKELLMWRAASLCYFWTCLLPAPLNDPWFLLWDRQWLFALSLFLGHLSSCRLQFPCGKSQFFLKILLLIWDLAWSCTTPGSLAPGIFFLFPTDLLTVKPSFPHKWSGSSQEHCGNVIPQTWLQPRRWCGGGCPQGWAEASSHIPKLSWWWIQRYRVWSLSIAETHHKAEVLQTP